eukprot:TRINITY_DN9855_c0_g2_i1.p1 TRINITY_DN9855_c0_g2~~TRINITY_DN9855_c0_g2_i1.p1  ORF type:complete len:108 (+),score=26.46 TRINITY_DN9855_c0_g2_i1:94-417(+)
MELEFQGSNLSRETELGSALSREAELELELEQQRGQVKRLQEQVQDLSRENQFYQGEMRTMADSLERFELSDQDATTPLKRELERRRQDLLLQVSMCGGCILGMSAK